MKLGVFAMPAAFLLTFAALLAGCGGTGSDPLTLEQYVVQFEAIQARFDAKISAESGEFVDVIIEDDIFGDDGDLPFFKDFYAVDPDIHGDFQDRLEDLEPPSEVADAHDELIAAGRDVAVAQKEAAEVLDEAETMADFSTLRDEVDPTILAASSRFAMACRAVVEIAEANGIANDISCGDEG